MALAACSPSGGGGGGQGTSDAHVTIVGDTSTGELAATPPDRTFEPECQVACRTEAEGAGCIEPPGCVDACVAQTAGLSTLCGKCVATLVYLDAEGGATCSMSLGDVTYSSCAEDCSPGTHSPRPDFGAECGVSCAAKADESDCSAPTSCVGDCMAMTQGLETQCGKCVATLVYEDGGDDVCSASFGDITYNACESTCEVGPHGTRPDFAAECATRCRLAAAESGCAAPPTNCVPDCLAKTAGLETRCGKCVSSLVYIDGDASSCEADIGDVTYTSCEAYCTPGTHRVRPDFRAECETSCREKADEAGCSAPPVCVSDCMALTAGVETQCGKCLSELVYMEGGGEGGACDYSIGDIEYSSCDTMCVPGTHQPRASFEAECQSICRRQSESAGCASIPEHCVSDCVAQTTGLETQCGKCIALTATYVEMNDGVCTSETLSVGDTSSCDDSCR